jgi:hypothetical protein
VVFVPPQKWKKAMGLGSNKDESRILASRQWPDSAHMFNRKKDADRAEAALIAYYGHVNGLFINKEGLPNYD